MQTNYKFEPDKHYLIYGIDFYNYCEITDLLIDSLSPYYNEIIYFNMTNHSFNIQASTECVKANFGLNIFEYYNNGQMKNIDSEYRYLTSLILKYISSSPSNSQFLSVQNLLQNIYAVSDSIDLSLELFISILDEIIEKSKKKEYKEFLKILVSIDKIKQENPEFYTNTDAFKKLAYTSRLTLEKFLFINNAEIPIVPIDFDKYIFNNEIIKFFKKLKGGLESAKYRFRDHSNTFDIVKDKINYFSEGLNFDHIEYVEIFLEFLTYRKKMNIAYKKPLIIIQGKQKRLFKSEYLTVSEIFNSVDLCFIVTDEKELDENINHLIDIKIFEDEHKKLSLKGKPINIIKFGDNRPFSISK